VRRAVQFAAVALVAIAAAAAGYGFNLWRLERGADPAAAAVLAARLTDLEGKTQALSQWRGKVLVVNFWATWCEPCREEIPLFVRLQKEHGAGGLQFIGIAIDQRDKVAAFAREFGMNYPVLLGGIDTIDLSRQAGNRAGALPFTVIIDREGRVAAKKLGELKERELDTLLRPLL
jgi:thiol-disulfide isomerase/thioredoxin